MQQGLVHPADNNFIAIVPIPVVPDKPANSTHKGQFKINACFTGNVL
jgi:hypothetical protein